MQPDGAADGGKRELPWCSRLRRFWVTHQPLRGAPTPSGRPLALSEPPARLLLPAVMGTVVILYDRGGRPVSPGSTKGCVGTTLPAVGAVVLGSSASQSSVAAAPYCWLG